MKLRDLDLEWLTVVVIGMFFHVNNRCIVGFCGDPAIASFQADFPFLLFILSVLTFVADHNWYPTSLRKPHKYVMLLINVVIALAVSNVALKLIWLPLQNVLLHCSVWIHKWTYGSRSTPSHSAWKVVLSDMLEQLGALPVPTPMLQLAVGEEDVRSALEQWTGEALLYGVSLALSLLLLGSRFFACTLWDRLRLCYLGAQASTRRRRGRILLLPGGSLARLRSLAPRYVLSKLEDDEADNNAKADKAEARSGGDAPTAHADPQQQQQQQQRKTQDARASPPPTGSGPRAHALGGPLSALPLTLAAPSAYAGPPCK